jgi:hypothetical protein
MLLTAQITKRRLITKRSVNHQLVLKWKKAAMTHFTVLSRHLSAVTEKKHEKSQPG